MTTPVAVALLHSAAARRSTVGESLVRKGRETMDETSENGHSDDDSGGGGSVVLSCINYSLAKLEFDGNFPSLAFDFYTESCSALGPWSGDFPRPFPGRPNELRSWFQEDGLPSCERATYSLPSLPPASNH